ncbi:MAG: 2-amino-4-hydroxy-6-hydroxymethyldihydropteridine diphosphokinase [Firmicutes bacterium]|nr:2-amino-4-hydroxy-6-hydroxymethyldihydropteridine diphosphokinase [Bacillota bacterium]
MDSIKISDLEIFASHGVLPEENVLGQKFVITAEVMTDFSRCAKDDDITKTVNYAQICEDIEKYTKENIFKLIETLAYGIAETILKKYDVYSVKVTVKKPSAPIKFHLDTVSVTAEMKWNEAIIALGSNMGDKESYLNYAVEKIGNDECCKVMRVSSFITTEPYGDVEQDDFLNGCMKIRTLYSPNELLDMLHRIENECDRKRIVRWGPRTLDLDIIMYNDDVIDEEELTIPHIEMTKRTFVMIPLCEIAPYKRHPVSGKTMTEILDELRRV